MEPYPRLHFFVPGYVEIFLRSRFKVFSMTQRLFDNKNIFLDCNLAQEYFFTATAIFRGQISPMHFEEEMRNMRVKYKNNFVEWIPHNTQTTVCSVPPSREKWSLTSVLNTTAIQQPFQTLLNFFRKQVHYKNYLHWYTQEGMEISQFENAQNKLDRLLCEYKEKQRTGNKN
ncbi:hypothetical protein DMN91_002571 [Ooceraea biroi]|uniref:Tubulin/FtsZ 2-layer sandwich domain-containing protein n=2 Tax=Ooceraea biroi TaxID=2015173 RepID=A0A3L8DVZ3_OOCBI|nr:tubulin beta-2 chain [Ooceraea biroi]RLU24482.1 hypothetical protein DMN91_002571 [Ooceraea biroi]